MRITPITTVAKSALCLHLKRLGTIPLGEKAE